MENKKVLFTCDNICRNQIDELAKKFNVSRSEIIRKSVAAYYYENGGKKNDTKRILRGK